MFVRKTISNIADLRVVRNDLFAHLVHSSLNRSALVFGKDLKSSIPDRLMDIVERDLEIRNAIDCQSDLWNDNIVLTFDSGGEDTVADVFESSIFVPDEAFES